MRVIIKCFNYIPGIRFYINNENHNIFNVLKKKEFNIDLTELELIKNWTRIAVEMSYNCS